MSEKVKFAVIGCGHIGKRYINTINSNPNAELAAVADTRNRESLNLPESGYRYYSSLDELLNAEPDVDVVTVATPNGLHYEQALKILQHGKHAIIEKPMTLNKSRAEELIDIATQNNLHIFPVMQNRFSPPSVWIRDIIRSGVLGEIYMVQVNCFWNRDERYYTPGSWHGTADMDGGTLYTQFSHFIDMVYWLFGDVENIRARLANFNHRENTEFEDSGIILFDFRNGGTGNINFTTSVWGSNLESSLTVIAENGSVKIGGQYMDQVEVCNIRNYSFEPIPEQHGDALSNHGLMIREVTDTIINGISPDYSAAKEGVRVIEIIEKVYEAGRAPTDTALNADLPVSQPQNP